MTKLYTLMHMRDKAAIGKRGILRRTSKLFKVPVLSMMWHGAQYACVPTRGFILFALFPNLNGAKSLAMPEYAEHWSFFGQAMSDYPTFVIATTMDQLMQHYPAMPRYQGRAYDNTHWLVLKIIAEDVPYEIPVNIFAAKDGVALLLQVFYSNRHSVALLLRPLALYDVEAITGKNRPKISQHEYERTIWRKRLSFPRLKHAV